MLGVASNQVQAFYLIQTLIGIVILYPAAHYMLDLGGLESNPGDVWSNAGW